MILIISIFVIVPISMFPVSGAAASAMCMLFSIVFILGGHVYEYMLIKI